MKNTMKGISLTAMHFGSLGRPFIGFLASGFLASERRAVKLVVTVLLTVAPIGIAPLNAAPQGGEIVGGSGSISSPTLNSTVINQNTQSMAINWQSFDVANGERVEFVQPSTTAALLNRIQGQSPSQIFGAIDANGHVFLINPHGILFGETATVNVGSLVASGLNIDSDAFMKGDLRLSALTGTEGGIVINQGVIEAATGGSVTLVGSSVQNQGVIVARMGSINLGAGNTAVIDFDGDGLMQFEVSGYVQENANQLTDAVANSGTLNAEGGHIAITAHTARNVFTNVINNTGIIKAMRIDKQGGTIRLTGQGGNVVSSGVIDASSNTANTNGGTIALLSDDQTLLTNNSVTTVQSNSAKGGTVHVLGHKVGLIDYSHINVSGETGGGTALIGGDFQGNNPLIQNADYTYVGANTVINASAENSGNGGKVVVWANEAARFYGSIIARGGLESGNGGFVEVSGKTYLRFNGSVDLSAPMGLSGTLLLDPDDLCITNGGVGSCAGATEDNTAPFSAATAGSNSYVLVTTLQGLGDVNIDLLADDDIIFDANVDLSASLTSANLTLNADNDADGTGGISMAGFDLSTGGGNIAFNVDALGEGITNIGTINTGGGSFTVNATGAMSQNIGDIITGTTRLVKQGSGTLTLTETNDYSGSTTIEGGTISIGTDANLGAAPGTATAGHLVLNGGTLASTADITLNQSRGIALSGAGTLDVANGTTLTYNGVIAGSGGTLTKNNSGSLSLGGSNTYTTATNINGGTVSISADENLGAAPGTATAGHLVLNGGTLASSADMTLNQNRGIALNGAGTLDVANGTTLTYNGVIAGSGGALTKANSGTLSLGGSNTYTTTTDVNAGTLSLGASNVISDSSAIRVNGGEFNLNGHNDTVASLTVNSGSMSTSAGTLTTISDLAMSGAGALITATTGNLIVGGNVELTNGTLLAPGNTGTFNVGGNWSNTGAVFTHNNGTVTLVGTGAQTITSAGQVFNNLSATGTGNVQLAQALSVEGVLTNSAGDLDTAGQTLNANTLTVSGGSVNSAGDDNGEWNIGNLNISGAGSLTATSGGFTVSGNWENSGGSFNHNNGTVILNGTTTQNISSGGNAFNNLTASGSSNVRLLQALDVAGTLNNSAGDFDTGGQVISTSNLVVSGGTINTAGDDTGEWDIGNLSISNNGALTATSGNIKVSGDWNNTGTFNHNNGTVVFDGSADQAITSNTGTSSENSFFNVSIDKTSDTVAFTDKVEINSLTTSNAAYNISFQGDDSKIETATVFNNTGNLELGNDGDNITFGNGATHTLGDTSINGSVTATTSDLQFSASRLTGRLIADAGTVTTTTLSALGTGDSISATTISTGDITIADANSISLSGATIDTGAISGTSNGMSSNIDINASGAVTIAGNIGTDIGTVTTASDSLSLQAVDTQGKQQYAANEIQLNGDLTGASELVLQTLDATQNIEIAGGGASAALDLTTIELGRLKGFSAITIGRNDSTGTLSVMAGETMNVTDSLHLIAGQIDVTGATITTNNNDLSLSSRVGNIALGQLNAGTGDVAITVAGNVTSDGSDPNIIAKNLRVEGSGTSLFGSFVSPMKLSGISDTATFLLLKEAHTDNLTANVIEGNNINIDNLSTAERIGTGQALGLSGINFIDPALFSADFSLFDVDQSGLKLPSDQLEEE